MLTRTMVISKLLSKQRETGRREETLREFSICRQPKPHGRRFIELEPEQRRRQQQKQRVGFYELHRATLPLGSLCFTAHQIPTELNPPPPHPSPLEIAASALTGEGREKKGRRNLQKRKAIRGASSVCGFTHWPGRDCGRLRKKGGLN